MQDYIPRRIDVNAVIDPLTVKQYDHNSRFLHVTLLDGDLPGEDKAFNLSDCRAALYIQPAGDDSGAHVSMVPGDVADEDGGIVTFLLPGGVTGTPGEYEAEVWLYEGDAASKPILSSRPFRLTVEKSIRNTSAVEASASFSALDAALSDVASLRAEMDALTAMADAGEIPAADLETEVLNIRVGADGTTYTSAGNAVRQTERILRNALWMVPRSAAGVFGEWERGRLMSGGNEPSAAYNQRIRMAERRTLAVPVTVTIDDGYYLFVHYYASADATYRDTTYTTDNATEGGSGWATGQYTIDAGKYFRANLGYGTMATDENDNPYLEDTGGNLSESDVTAFAAHVHVMPPLVEEVNRLTKHVGTAEFRLESVADNLSVYSADRWGDGVAWIGGSLNSNGTENNDNARRVRLNKRVKFNRDMTFTIDEGYQMLVYYYASENAPYCDTSYSSDNATAGKHDWTGTAGSCTVDGGQWVNMLLSTYPETGAIPDPRTTVLPAHVFIDATTPLTAAVRSLQNDQPGNTLARGLVTSQIGRALPGYLAGHLAARKTAVEAAALAVGNHGDVFAYFTDCHYSVSDANTYGFSYLPDMLRELGIRKVVFGGDILQTHNTDTDSTGREKALDILRRFAQDFGKFPLYPLFGNHETNPYASDTSDRLTESEVYEYLFRRTGVEDRAALQPEMYYYFDNQPQKIRYICLNTHATGAEWMADHAQKEWLAGTLAAVPAGWRAVVLTHMFFELKANADDVSGRIYVSSIGQSIQTLLDAYVRRGSGTWGGHAATGDLAAWTGAAYDFSGCQGELLCVLAGHTHNDYAVYSGAGYPIIAVTCEAQWGSNHSLLREGDPYPSATGDRQFWRGGNATGTTREHAFDVVCIDTAGHVIRTVRLGDGSDRVFHLAPVTAAGTLVSELSGTLTWSSSDTSVATVSGGAVTRVAAGGAFVTAAGAVREDGSRPTEMWAVQFS